MNPFTETVDVVASGAFDPSKASPTAFRSRFSTRCRRYGADLHQKFQIITPHFNALRLSGGEAVLSVAANSRYNDIQIDGSARADGSVRPVTNRCAWRSVQRTADQPGCPSRNSSCWSLHTMSAMAASPAEALTSSRGVAATSSRQPRSPSVRDSRSCLGELPGLVDTSRDTRVGDFDDVCWGAYYRRPSRAKPRLFVWECRSQPACHTFRLLNQRQCGSDLGQ